MSVLIKNMEMPERCGQCFLRVGNCKQRIYMERRPKGCPLVEVKEPHGRLIDIKSLEDNKFETVENDLQRWWNGATDNIIGNAPTVIEAEGSET